MVREQRNSRCRTGLRKGRGTRDQIANICWIIEKAAELKTKSASLTTWKPLTVWITTNWKILRDGNARPLYMSPEKLYADQEATVRTKQGTMNWFKIGKGVCQGCILSPCLFNFYAEYIMWNARLDESQPGIKTTGRNVNNLRNADDTTLMAESEEELKSLLIRVKEESERSWLKTQYSKNEDHGIQFHHFMAKKEGKSRRNDRFYFLGLQNHCSQEIKRCCSLEGKL